MRILVRRKFYGRADTRGQAMQQRPPGKIPRAGNQGSSLALIDNRAVGKYCFKSCEIIHFCFFLKGLFCS